MSSVKEAVKGKEADKGKDSPTVLAVFVADCQATKGPGSTVAVVKGSSGKCRLYGKDSLANAFPLPSGEPDPLYRTLNTSGKLSEHFTCPVIIGRDACLAFVKDHAIAWDGKEAVIADKGKGNKKRGGFRQLDYRTF